MLKRFLLVILSLLALLAVVILLKTFLTRPPLKIGRIAGVKNPALSPLAIRHLQDAVQIKTISWSDTAKAETTELVRLQAFLQSNYPLVKSHLQKTIINGYNLLYRWAGSDASLPPIILAAHMDVVPADTAKTSGWEMPPYSGQIKGNFIYGRGTLDDKISVIGIMEAAEQLLSTGFHPRRTIYFAFGYNEEIGGIGGAQAIADYLSKKNIKAFYVLDEGMAVTKGIISGIQTPVALIGIAEKGFVSLNLKVRIPGGHSSYPYKDNAISVLARAENAIASHPMETRFTEPILTMFNQLAPQMPFFQRLALENRWLFGPLILRQMSNSHTLNAGIRTTCAPTIFKAGIKDNIVPDEATAVLNYRILPGDSIAGVIHWVKKQIRDDRVQITAEKFASQPSPVSNVQSGAFSQLGSLVQSVFPETSVAPTLVIGATDSRYYRNISENIFRFTPMVVDDADLNRIHGSNERISFSNFQKAISFYYNLMLIN
jgi:carboxypeptidase PM20D1